MSCSNFHVLFAMMDLSWEMPTEALAEEMVRYMGFAYSMGGSKQSCGRSGWGCA